MRAAQQELLAARRSSRTRLRHLGLVDSGRRTAVPNDGRDDVSQVRPGVKVPLASAFEIRRRNRVRFLADTTGQNSDLLYRHMLDVPVLVPFRAYPEVNAGALKVVHELADEPLSALYYEIHVYHGRFRAYAGACAARMTKVQNERRNNYEKLIGEEGFEPSPFGLSRYRRSPVELSA
jgi:hypothetical protein